MRDIDLVNTSWMIHQVEPAKAHKLFILLSSLNARIYHEVAERYDLLVDKYPYILRVLPASRHDITMCTKDYDDIRGGMVERISYEEVMYNIQKMIDERRRFGKRKVGT